ncbi:Cobalt transport protein CbiM [bioreactor metagenome]|uniref:Cobalt transport protein CbiM n=1 Tax=bioreactor metagenome TaxID=1076179 RepID=A0A645A9D8_9ZZZZ
MHMADALLSPAVGGAMSAVSAAAIGYSVKKISGKDFDEKQIPMMGVMGAFVFAGQMINFTIPGTGSSGHIGGGILLAAVLGPFPALLTLTAVLLIQCLFFADGGLLALGCNIFNMGFIPCLVIYPLLFRPLVKRNCTLPRITAASILSVVVGLQLGAFGVVVQTLLSGITALPFSTFLLLMQPIHLAIGLVEGIITAAILGFVWSLRPELLETAARGGALGSGVSVKRVVVSLAVLAVLVGGGLSLFASSYPDGLEWSMEKTAGTAELEAEGPVFHLAAAIQEATAFLPDYDFASAGEEGVVGGTTVSGLAGGAMTFALAGAAGLLISKTRKRHTQSV